MATSKSVTVQSSAATVLVQGPQGTAEVPVQVAIRNNSAVTIYIGGAATSSTLGYPLAATTSLPFLIPLQGDTLYAIAASNTAQVGVTVIGGQ